MAKARIKRGGLLTVDFTNEQIIINGFHFVSERLGEELYQSDAVGAIISTLRRGQYAMRKREAKEREERERMAPRWVDNYDPLVEAVQDAVAG